MGWLKTWMYPVLVVLGFPVRYQAARYSIPDMTAGYQISDQKPYEAEKYKKISHYRYWKTISCNW